ncbi:MAG: type IV secretion system DNA-binding domain-containing protein [Nitrospirota bacterium]
MSEGFKAFEIWVTKFKLAVKMYVCIGLAFIALQMLITVGFTVHWYGDMWANAFKYACFFVPKHVWPDTMSEFFSMLGSRSMVIFGYSSAIWFLYPVSIIMLNKRAKRQQAECYISGAKLITAERLNKAIRKEGEKADLQIGEVNIPKSAEPKHALIIGRPGVGKTVCLSQVLARLKARGERGIVYDFKGDYLSKFYDPEKDIIFNPLDARGIGWNLFNEIKTQMDVEAIAHSLVPESYQQDPFWNKAARDVFSGMLHYLWQNNQKSNPAIWDAITSSGNDITGWLKETPGGESGHVFVQDASSKQAMSVYAVLMQYASCFKYMPSTDSNFSIIEWLQNGKGWIYVVNYADVQDTLKPILSLFIDLLGRKLLSMKDDYKRRVFFLIDEFGTLQRLSTIKNLLTLSRSKGGSVWLGCLGSA